MEFVLFMKRTIFILTAIVLLITGMVLVAAKQCELPVLESSLRNALYSYYTNPSYSSLSTTELRDLLNYYLEVKGGSPPLNCNTRGAETNTKIQDIMDKSISEQIIPVCSDGTEYAECSTIKPLYCFNGRLTDKCSVCGCEDGKSCSPSEKC